MRWVVLLVIVSLMPLSGCARQVTLDPGEDPEVPAGLDPDANPLLDLNAEELVTVIEDDNRHIRLAASATLIGRDDIPLEERVDLLVRALEREIEDPDQGRAPLGAWLPAEEYTRMHLVEIIAALEPDAAPIVRQTVGTASPEARDYLTVALASLEDPDAISQTRDLLATSPNPWLRAEAATALGGSGGDTAVAPLQAALEDPYMTRVSDCIGEFNVFPVREAAANALRDLGLTVNKRADGTFEVRE